MDIPTVPAKEPKPRKSKKGYKARHPGGVLTRRPHGGARNTRSKAIHVKAAAASKHLMGSHLDGRSLLGRAYRQDLATFKAHLNGDISAPVAKLLDQAVRLGLLANLSWGEITEAGALIQDGKPHPAIDIYLKVAKQQREVLVLLGLPHRAKDISLQDVLQGRVEHASP